MGNRISQIEVLGEQMSIPGATVQRGSMDVRFVSDPQLKQSEAFALGAFFTKALLSPDVMRYPRHRRIAVITESPNDPCLAPVDVSRLGERFPLVFTHQEDLLARGGPFQPLLFGTNWISVRDDAAAQQISATSPEKTALCSFMGSLAHPDTGAYRFRREVAAFAVSHGRIDCFGKGIRPVAGKREAIEPYHFSIAMENAASDHYFSEKLIDCLLLETVPIYYGCPGIGDMFDTRGFLQFRTLEELTALLDSLSPELYETMRPFALRNKRLAIANRWHNHAGLFGRLVDALPEAMLLAPAMPFRPLSRIERRFRQWTGWSRRG